MEKNGLRLQADQDLVDEGVTLWGEEPAPERKVSARLRSPPHIPVPADAIATRSHLPLLTVLLAMPFVVFPPPSHKLHLGSPRGGDGTRSLGAGGSEDWD